jgi:hypothetical protein
MEKMRVISYGIDLIVATGKMPSVRFRASQS